MQLKIFAEHFWILVSEVDILTKQVTLRHHYL